MVGYTFDGAGRAATVRGRTGFLAATAKAKEILAGSEAEGSGLAPRIGVSGGHALAIYRQRLHRRDPRRPVAMRSTTRRRSSRSRRDGGADLVGPRRASLQPARSIGPGPEAYNI